MNNATDAFLDEGMCGWIEKTARSNYWRVASWYDLPDLVQDGYMAYAKCRAAYPELMAEPKPTQDQRKHVMALVQTAFERRIVDLANKRTRHPQEVGFSTFGTEGGQDSEATLERYLPAVQETSTFFALLSQAPAEIKQLITLLAQDGSELLRFQRRRVGRRALRETKNEYFCRLLGKDPLSTDMVGQVKAYFGLSM